jgi:p-hydroxybenzoate 3-monooxygenase
VPLSGQTEHWSDEVFWSELRCGLLVEFAETLVTGPSIETSITPLRSFISEPISWGRLILVGDAAHIVPPTGAKGLNLAAPDVYYLSRALIAAHAGGRDHLLRSYSDQALARVWRAPHFSWAMMRLLHNSPEEGGFLRHIQAVELAYGSKQLPFARLRED